MASEKFQLDAGEIDRIVREVLQRLKEKQDLTRKTESE